ncbi:MULTISPECIES: hypothetical protein [Calothrix]|uniref:Uncharacterized protein n=2 Tax=Calothrix TaxID=1186 RepID=A0ABR8ABN1_9CYAN|nr:MULTISPECIES: hypothetical protein [Calothrix]MBD2196855.1 hypothetical protein [Calothrix parietina FACHB-288]MBD2225475.1 hypothetical protein [Calothrix anomala FACHB-343]
MSRITISDLAIDSNSFINEVDETEAAFVNGGFGKKAAFKLLTGILASYAEFGKIFLATSDKIVNFLISYLSK